MTQVRAAAPRSIPGGVADHLAESPGIVLADVDPAAQKTLPDFNVTAANAGAYLALSNVACVGGSWLTPRETIAAGDFEKIEQLARAAAQLARA